MTETKPIRALVMGASGAGKTGSLASLVKAGFNLRVIDLDNNIPVLLDLLSKESEEVKKRLDFVTLTEPMRVLGGKIVPAKASVWQKTVSLLEHWKHGEVDLGKVTSWGPTDVLCLDTMSSLGTAARNFHLSMNGKLVADRSQNEGLRDIGSAQSLLDTFCQLISDESIKCHVIVNTHVVWAKEDGKNPSQGEDDAVLHAFPAAIGKSFSAQVAKYFNTMVIVKKVGFGSRIYTSNQPNIALKTAAPTRVKREYSLESGMAELFKDMSRE